MRSFDDEIKLVKKARTGDRTDSGFGISGTNEPRKVFASAKSVGYSEHYESLIKGEKAVKKFDMWKHEYEGENIVEFEGKQYRVTRSYTVRDPEVIELTVTDVGVGGNG